MYVPGIGILWVGLYPIPYPTYTINGWITIVLRHHKYLYMIPIESIRTVIFNYEWPYYSDPALAIDNYLAHHIEDGKYWVKLPRQVLTYQLAQILCLRGKYRDAMKWLARSTTQGQLKGWDNMVYLTSYYIEGEVVQPPPPSIPCDNVHQCWRMYHLARAGVYDYRRVWTEGYTLLGGVDENR
jgi:hypothetical protein